MDLRWAECSDQFNHQEAGIKESSQGSVASYSETAIREDDTSDITECEPEQVKEEVANKPSPL